MSPTTTRFGWQGYGDYPCHLGVLMTPDEAIASNRYDEWLCCKRCGESFPKHDRWCDNPDK